MGQVIQTEEITKQLSSLNRRVSDLEYLYQNLNYYVMNSILYEAYLDVSADIRTTTSSSYGNIDDFIIEIDFDKQTDKEWYFEAVLKTQTSGTAYARLYNLTDTEVVSGSEISTTDTSYDVVRSSSLTKYTGTKKLVVQTKHSAGGQTVSLSGVRHVFRRTQ